MHTQGRARRQRRTIDIDRFRVVNIIIITIIRNTTRVVTARWHQSHLGKKQHARGQLAEQEQRLVITSSLDFVNLEKYSKSRKYANHTNCLFI